MKRRAREWFDDESFWEDLYPAIFTEARFAAAAAEVDQVLALAAPQGRSALDLCCGPGRCSIALAQRGYAVTGVDRSAFLLGRARRRARSAHGSLRWVQADMRDFVRPETFDLIVNLFTSFGYFEKCEDDRVVLANMLRSLRPGGACVIDVIGKEVLARIFQPTRSETLPGGLLWIERHRIVADWTRLWSEWTLVQAGRAKSRVFTHTVYSGRELRERMEQAGFADVRLYGDLDGSEYGTAARRLVAVGRRPVSGR